ncbi:nuclear transport factor 2 family protein [Balneolaceae bacterium YR4-1]|uniref:Nuclear transport factor 2 family protein n=1 Tax=Halalkalibaculum roseum TaxID=2709311 RepID=A0A6M1SVP2_9BACT|nr:nuclear transport factor 2 family protein [Halalkalibaculum roseum]NGP75014.1 nuclear transport factor 2 family protein [Halalkalibaculum roseum]
MKKTRVWTGGILMGMMLLAGCTQVVEDGNERWDIGSPEYAEMAEQAMMHMQSMDFDAWGEMLADDIEYYFPDGDAGTRTVLTGKTAVLDWWKNWENTSGVSSMTFSNPVFLPVVAREAPNYAGLTGPYVISYMSNEMVFNGSTVNIRMNFTLHFNDEKKIDRYYSYYDRSPIINAMGTNILSTSEEN